MCGIVGAAGYLGPKEKDVVKDLLVMDALRGKHSTGLMSVDKGANVSYVKAAVTPHDFLDMGKVSKTFNINSRVLLGHNRYATQGAVNNNNAHPFMHGDIAGVHNGTLRKQYQLVDSKNFVVDSENIIHSLNKVGEEETVKQLDGAYALVWWDMKVDALKFLRNTERPMYICAAADDKTFFWASEEYMLKAALVRRNIQHTDIVAMEPHQLYTFDLKLDEVGVPVLDKPSIKKLAPPPPTYPAVRTQYQGYSRGSSKGQPQGGSNPTPKNGNKAVKKNPPFLAKYNYHLDSKVPFYILEAKGNTAFGETLDGNMLEVRIHCGTKAVADQLLDWDGFYMSAGITGFRNDSGNKDGYLSMSRGYSIAKLWGDLPEDCWDSIPPISGDAIIKDEQGQVLTRDVFNKRFKDGCSVCSNPLSYDLPSDFQIISKSAVICTDCKDLPIASQYIN